MNKPENHRHRWSKSDDAKLRMMLNHGVDVNDIAETLQRTPATIRWRWWHLRLVDAADDLHNELANETSVVLPTGEMGEMGPLSQKKTPIEMIERRWLFGLITTVRFKYNDDN